MRFLDTAIGIMLEFYMLSRNSNGQEDLTKMFNVLVRKLQVKIYYM